MVAAWACVGSLASCPGVLSSMPMGLHARTCGLRPAQAHIPAPALSWEFGRSWLIHNLKSWGSLWSAMVHLFPETSFAPVTVSLSFLQLQFCAVLSSFSVSHLLNWISFSAFRLNAPEIISRILNPVSGQHSSYIPNPWLFTVPETWSPKVFFLPELSNKVKWEKSGIGLPHSDLHT